MSLIATTKYGDCSNCPATNTNVVKRGKVLLCLNCKRAVDNKNQLAKQRERIQVRSLIDKKPTEQKNLQELWFAMVAQEIEKSPYCWETGDFIQKEVRLFGTERVMDNYRNASCHILPKSIFKSVATHPLNFLILSASNGSHEKTHRVDTFVKMKCWPIAAERLKQILPYVKERHKILALFKEKINYIS